MKLIKFDLPIDGVKIATVEDLRDHFTTEVLAHYRSGLLGKWLRARRLEEQLAALDAIAADADDVTAMAELCRIFAVEADVDTIRAALAQPTGIEGSRLDGAVARREVEHFLFQLAVIAEVFIDNAVKAVPLTAHGYGNLLWTDGAFEAGSLVAWTGKKSDQNTLAPGPGVLIDKQVVHTSVKNGEMIGWFQLSDIPEAYAKDILGLRWTIKMRHDTLRDFVSALDEQIERGDGSVALLQSFRDHLAMLADALNHAMEVAYQAYQAGSVDYLRENLDDPVARRLLFRA